MAGPKFHIARGSLELGVLAQSEIYELLAAGMLLPGDLFWSEGQTSRRPLSELARPANPSRTSMAGQLRKTVWTAAKSVRAGAILASTKVSSAAGRKQAAMTEAANRMLEDFLPRLRGLVATTLKKTMPSAEAALRNEVFLRKLFGAVYDVLPKPVRRFVGEEIFVEFCLRHKQRLLGKET